MHSLDKMWLYRQKSKKQNSNKQIERSNDRERKPIYHSGLTSSLKLSGLGKIVNLYQRLQDEGRGLVIALLGWSLEGVY